MDEFYYKLKAHTRLRYIALLVVAILTSSFCFADEDEEQTRRQLQQLSSEMKELRTLLDNFKTQRSELQNSLRKSEVAIGQIQNKIRSIQQQLKNEETELRSLQQQRKSLQSSKREQQIFIEQQVLAAYQVGQQKKIKILLNQEQPDKISRALAYYDYFNEARSEQINSYVTIINELNNIEPRIIEKTQNLSLAKTQLGEEHKLLLNNKEQRKANLNKINSKINNNDQRLKKITKDRSELERLLSAFEQTLANITIPSEYSPFKNLKGKLPWPVKGKPNNRFGHKRNNTSMLWQGLAIPATEGSQVEAIHHGRVVFADWLRGSGLLVIVDHGDGYMSLYAHNQSLLRETGDWVNPGDTIATVGNSGGQQQAGLYFEIRHNGKPTDPRKWCRRV